MSLFATSIVIAGVALASFALGFASRQYRINCLLSGQRKWRSIAFHHASQTVSARGEARLLNNLLAATKGMLELREAGLKRIVVGLWGAPLDRTVEDVLDRWNEMLTLLTSANETSAGLAAVAKKLDEEKRGLKAQVNEWQTQASVNAQFVYNLIDNRWSIRTVGGGGNAGYPYAVINEQDEVLATGESPEEVMKLALEAKQQAEPL